MKDQDKLVALIRLRDMLYFGVRPTLRQCGFAPEIVQDVYDYVRLKNFIAALFTRKVDVIDRHALKPYVRPPAEGDAVYAF